MVEKRKLSLSGLINYFDRNKEKKGLQLTKQPIMQSARAAVSNLGQNLNQIRQQGSDFLQDTSQDIRDWQARNRQWAQEPRVPESVYDPVYSFGTGTIKGQTMRTGVEDRLLPPDLKDYEPSTPVGKATEVAGQAFGTFLNPLSTPKRMATGLGLGAGSQVVSNVLTDKPILEDTLESGTRSMTRSPLFGITDPTTEKILNQASNKLPFLKQFTQQGLAKDVGPGAMNFARKVGQWAIKGGILSPGRTFTYAGLDALEKEGVDYFQAVGDRFVSDLFANMTLNAAFGTYSTYKNQQRVKTELGNVKAELAKKLGIDSDSTQAEYKSAWRQWSAKNHPDRGGSEEAMKEMNNLFTKFTKTLKLGYSIDTAKTGDVTQEIAGLLPAEADSPVVTLPSQDAAALDLPKAPTQSQADEIGRQKVANYLTRRFEKAERRELGKYMLREMQEKGVSPQKVAQEFWSNTFPKLPSKGQKNAIRQLEAHWGEKVRDEDHLQYMIENVDLGGEAEFLEGGDRGFVTLMNYANQKMQEMSEAPKPKSPLRIQKDLSRFEQPMSDSEMKALYKRDWTRFGESEFGDKFDEDKWLSIFESQWRKYDDKMMFAKDFQLGQQFRGQSGSVKALLDYMGKSVSASPGEKPTGKIPTKQSIQKEAEIIKEDVDYDKSLDALAAEQDTVLKAQREKTDDMVVNVAKGEKDPVKLANDKQMAEKKADAKSKVLIPPQEFKQMERVEQVAHIKKARQLLYKAIGKLEVKMNQEYDSSEDFIREIDRAFNQGVEPSSELVVIHNNYTQQVAQLVKEYDPSFEPISGGFYPHRDLSRVKEDNFDEILKDLWIRRTDFELGHFKRRENKLGFEDIDKSYGSVMKSHADQTLLKTYVKNLKPDNEFQEVTSDYSKKVFEIFEEKDTRALRELPTPNFVQAGKDSYDINKTITFKMPPLQDPFRTMENITKNIGGEVRKAWILMRDLQTEGIVPEYNRMMEKGKYEKAGIIEDKVKQNLLETLVKYDYEDVNLETYINNYIANQVSIRQAKLGWGDHLTDIITKTFARAHLGLKVKTATSQLLESTKLSAYFNPDEITAGMKKLLDMEEVKRMRKAYALDEFTTELNEEKLRAQIEHLKSQGLFRQGVEGMDKVIFSLVNAGEYYKNLIVGSIAEENGLKQDFELESEELTAHVRNMVHRVGNVASEHTRIPAMENNFARLLLGYSGYSIRDTAEFLDEARGGELRASIIRAASRIMNMLISITILGGSTKYALDMLSPAGIGPLFTLGKDIYNTLTNNWSKESKVGKLKRLGFGSLSPTGSQTLNITEGYQAGRGLDKTYAGKTRIYGEPVGAFRRLQAMIYGPGVLPDVKKAWRTGNYPLSERQSAAFQDMTREQQIKYQKDYTRLRDKRAADKEKREALEKKRGKVEIKGDIGQVEADMIKDRIKNEDETLTNEELLRYYSRDLDLEKIEDSKYEEMKREKEIFKTLTNVKDHNRLTDEQKDAIINTLLESTSETRADFDYYHIANDTVSEKTAYVQDQIAQIARTSKDRGDLIRFLVAARKEVNGQILASSGVLENLRDANLISEAEYDQLKDLKYGKDMIPGTKISGRGSGAKLKNVVFNPPEVKTVKTQAAKIPGFTATLKAAATPKVKTQAPKATVSPVLKTQSYTSQPDQAIANIRGREFNI